MSKLIFFDTETTGNKAEDFLCQIAYKSPDESFNMLFKPPKTIPPEASAVHHISNKMVADAPTFAGSAEHEKIKTLFEDSDSIVVAHNAPFDLAMLAKEGINPKRFICTLRVARHLDPEEKIDRYNLQYLRYLLEIEVNAQAHDAMGDVLVLERLFARLLKKMCEAENLSEAEATEKMIEISSHPSLLRSFKFGKYKGKRIEEIFEIDRGYLEWLLSQKQNGDEIDEDWIYTLNYHLNNKN